MTGACHGTTAIVGCNACRARQAVGCAGAVGRRLALRPGSAPAGIAWSDAGADCRCPRHWSCDRWSAPGQGAKALDASGATGSVMGWSPARGDERRAGARVPRALGGVRCRRWHADRRAAASGLGPAAGASHHPFGRLSTAGASRLAHVAPDTRHPKSDPLAQEQWKKNSPMRWMPSSIPQRSAADESA